MAVIDVVEHARQLPPKPSVHPHAKDAGNGVGGEPKQAHVTRPLEDLVDREMAPKDEIPTVLHLVQGVLASPVHGGAIFA
jgi:hypothetical protein